MKKLFKFGLFLFCSISLYSNEPTSTNSLNILQIVKSSPLIYSALIFLSISSLSLCIYSLITFSYKNKLNSKTVENLKNLLKEKKFKKALDLCASKKSLIYKMIKASLSTKEHGFDCMLNHMKDEAKRLSTNDWQKIALLNDIVLIAPMLGLLGTVLGMFYAFYDTNRSVERIVTLFDGLGLAVGTTVVGLIVAIIAMVFSSFLKHVLIKNLNQIEKKAVELSSLITTKEI